MEESNRLLKKYKSKLEMEYVNSKQSNKTLKIKNDLLNLEKDFRKLNGREIKNSKELGDLFSKAPVPLPRPK